MEIIICRKAKFCEGLTSFEVWVVYQKLIRNIIWVQR